MKHTIDELAEIIDGDRGKNYPKQNEFFDEGYCLFLNTGNVTTSGFSFDSNQYISKEKCDLLRKGKLQRRDIVYTTRGTVGNAAFYSEKVPYEHIRINSGMVILRPNEDVVCTEFLYQILKSDYYRPYFKQYCTGSAQPQLPIKNFSKIELEIPELSVQKKIAKILFTYDDLIENNQKQIKLLEEAAQRLYKEWFVDLCFPGHEEVTIVDGVPEGWKKELIGNLIGKVIRSKQVKTAEYLKEGAIPVVDQSRDFIAGYTNDPETVVSIGYPVIVFGDHTRILKYIQFPFAKGADGTQLIVSDNENMPQSLLYYSLIAVDLSNYHYARHFKYLKAESILVPSKEIAYEFDRCVVPMLLQIQQLRNIADKAAEARDRLLPKLMSGEIEV